MKTKVYFTVDTEASMGGAWSNPGHSPVPAERHVFCKSGDRSLGIPLIVEMMGRYGFAATYFVETLATAVLGDADTASIFDYLLARGQDVQLHVHPNFRFYAEAVRARAEGRSYEKPVSSDQLGRLGRDAQLDLLGAAVDYFRRFAGFRPAVFRAGNFCASSVTMGCLRELGFRADSSFNPAFPEVSFAGESLEPNRVRQVEGVWEIPVTVARTPLPENATGLKFADCTALCYPEIRRMLEASAAAGQEHFVMVFHSFAAAKAKDVGYRELRPNRIVIRRLEKVFQYLAAHAGRFQVSTLGEMAAALRNIEGANNATVVELGWLRAGIRKAVQLVNRPYWV